MLTSLKVSFWFYHLPFETPFLGLQFLLHKFPKLTNSPIWSHIVFFCLLLFPPHISVFATVTEPVFQTKNGFLYKSIVCHHRDQIYLEPENCCYQCWYTQAQIEQRKRQILSFTKNRLLNITLGHQKQLLYDRRQALDSKLFVSLTKKTTRSCKMLVLNSKTCF